MIVLEKRMAPGRLQKGTQAARKWDKQFEDLITCEKVIQEKYLATTLMSSKIFDITFFFF